MWYKYRKLTNCVDFVSVVVTVLTSILWSHLQFASLCNVACRRMFFSCERPVCLCTELVCRPMEHLDCLRVSAVASDPMWPVEVPSRPPETDPLLTTTDILSLAPAMCRLFLRSRQPHSKATSHSHRAGESHRGYASTRGY